MFEACFRDWVETLREILPGEVIAIDGKTLRRSHDRGKGVTLDAMGCQTKIAAQIVDQGADYVLALKGNQSTLATEVEEAFINADARDYADVDSQFLETVEQGHGRRERCRYRTLGDLSGVSRRAGWKALNMIGMIESEREINGVTSRETRYYIASTDTDVSVFARAVRGHWGVENQLHWSLDVAFNEDTSRVRDPDARENLAVMRRVALTRLKHDNTKLGIQSKRLKAAWNEVYLEKLLFEAPKYTAKSSTSKSLNIRKT
ncbi:transposase IS4 family protein [Thiorhodococcus drewsii AZ1]|uniref:Transposase IS4 family protein n=1 Tax=Thiorhodococcus drewsii AZ1 TaxID=765913 RepID=G2E7F2_9GAMM|nr:ISAs1 family transposase [Thiorhodococcus drewsii]EGV27991.1 transposase IS4 family protein [Thiorhodococcus drewsii AZ1]